MCSFKFAIVGWVLCVVTKAVESAVGEGVKSDLGKVRTNHYGRNGPTIIKRWNEDGAHVTVEHDLTRQNSQQPSIRMRRAKKTTIPQAESKKSTKKGLVFGKEKSAKERERKHMADTNSSAGTPTADATNTFPTSVPVQSGTGASQPADAKQSDQILDEFSESYEPGKNKPSKVLPPVLPTVVYTPDSAAAIATLPLTPTKLTLAFPSPGKFISTLDIDLVRYLTEDYVLSGLLGELRDKMRGDVEIVGVSMRVVGDAEFVNVAETSVRGVKAEEEDKKRRIDLFKGGRRRVLRREPYSLVKTPQRRTSTTNPTVHLTLAGNAKFFVPASYLLLDPATGLPLDIPLDSKTLPTPTMLADAQKTTLKDGSGGTDDKYMELLKVTGRQGNDVLGTLIDVDVTLLHPAVSDYESPGAGSSPAGLGGPDSTAPNREPGTTSPATYRPNPSSDLPQVTKSTVVMVITLMAVLFVTAVTLFVFYLHRRGRYERTSKGEENAERKRKLASETKESWRGEGGGRGRGKGSRGRSIADARSVACDARSVACDARSVACACNGAIGDEVGVSVSSGISGLSLQPYAPIKAGYCTTNGNGVSCGPGGANSDAECDAMGKVRSTRFLPRYLSPGQISKQTAPAAAALKAPEGEGSINDDKSSVLSCGSSSVAGSIASIRSWLRIGGKVSGSCNITSIARDGTAAVGVHPHGQDTDAFSVGACSSGGKAKAPPFIGDDDNEIERLDHVGAVELLKSGVMLNGKEDEASSDENDLEFVMIDGEDEKAAAASFLRAWNDCDSQQTRKEQDGEQQDIVRIPNAINCKNPIDDWTTRDNTNATVGSAMTVTTDTTASTSDASLIDDVKRKRIENVLQIKSRQEYNEPFPRRPWRKEEYQLSKLM